MSNHIKTFDAKRLEELAADVAALKNDQRRQEAEKQAARAALTVPQAPRPSALARSLGTAQEEARRLRVDAAAEVEKAYTEQLERIRPQTEKLGRELAALDDELREEDARYRHVVDAINERRQTTRRKLDGLQTPEVSFDALMAQPERLKAVAEVNERLAAETFIGPAARPPVSIRTLVGGVNGVAK